MNDQIKAETAQKDVLRRIAAIEARQRAAGQHDPGCPAAHDCMRDHPTAAVYHYPQPCSCWLSTPPADGGEG